MGWVRSTDLDTRFVIGQCADMYHPWRHLQQLAEWELEWKPLPEDMLGITHFRERRMFLDPCQLQAQRRSTIAHELTHAERGPTLDAAWWVAREEHEVDRIAARRLIDVRALADALAWSQDPHEVADELWVDVPTLEARLADLDDDERHYLHVRLGAH